MSQNQDKLTCNKFWVETTEKPQREDQMVASAA